MTRKIKVGITVQIKSENESLFTNGIRQNIIILRELYEKCKNVEKAFLVNIANIKITEKSSHFGEYAKNIINLEEAYNNCDLIVVCHGSLNLEEYKKFTSKGIKMVKLILGAQQTVFTETILFKPNENAFNIYKKNNYVSAVWMSEHYYENEKNFHEIIYDCEPKIAPYVWSPRFIEKQQQILSKNILYNPSGEKEKKISSFEPNISMAKNLMMPLMISEKFYRKHPDLIKKIYMFNSIELTKKRDFVDFAKDLESHKNSKLFFQPGKIITSALIENTDIVLSHQIGNALNYLYLDAAWFGYPVLHNSDMMKNIGFYYPKNNVEKAIEQLEDIIENFDKTHEEYLKKSRKNSKKYFIENKNNIEGYEKLFDEAMK